MRCGLVGLCLAACSFANLRPPKPDPLASAADCGAWEPLADLVIGGASLLGGLAIAIDDYSGPDGYEGLATRVLGAPLIAIGTVGGASSIYGFSVEARCSRMRSPSPRERARALADVASEHAVAGRCREAFSFGRDVLSYDRDVYLNDLLARPSMVRCKQLAAERARGEAERRQLAERHDVAQALVKSARAAAAAGDCVTPRNFEARILALDAEIHRVWFVTDAAIAACLEPSK